MGVDSPNIKDYNKANEIVQRIYMLERFLKDRERCESYGKEEHRLVKSWIWICKDR